jgi:hypothetical protein
MNEHHDNVKNALDFVAIFSTFGSFLELFNPMFALIGAIVGVMRIVEMVTGKPFSVVIGWKKGGKDASDQ